MHYVNCFSVNLETAYMGQYISVNDIAHLQGQLCRVYENIKKFVDIAICLLLCILEGFLLFLGIL